MDRIRIKGGKALSGKVRASGAKNAALPLLVSSLLTDGECVFGNVPKLRDIDATLAILKELGKNFESAGPGKWKITDGGNPTSTAPYDLVRKMRASFLVLGPLLARHEEAKVSLPGGCAIGARPVDFHLAALTKLGAEIEIEGGYVLARAKGGLRGNRVVFPFPSVGATENLMMAAALAKGETLLENCAREPEIIDLAITLRRMGAQVEGEGSEAIKIQGKSSLSGCTHDVMGDRIEAGTFLCAAFATGGSVAVEGIYPEYLEALLVRLEDAGAIIERGNREVYLKSSGTRKGTDVVTLPYPGFPTDMQAQFMVAMAVSEGASMITETVFENRFMHVPELCRLGADITIKGKSALVRGVPKLMGAPMMATDLRASASLVIGALCAEGESIVSRIYHLDRGYDGLEKKMQMLGADIERLKD